MIKKWISRIIGIILVSILISSCTAIDISDKAVDIMFTVIRIMFSIAVSLILSFSFIEVKNEKLVKENRKQLKKITSIYIWLFTIATISFLFSFLEVSFKIWVIKFEFSMLIKVFIAFVLLHFIANFYAIIQLKEKLDEKVRVMNLDK